MLTRDLSLYTREVFVMCAPSQGSEHLRDCCIIVEDRTEAGHLSDREGEGIFEENRVSRR